MSAFHSRWQQGIDRVWIGPEYWGARLQDWRLRNGRAECVEASKGKPMRTLHLLTARLSDRPAPFVVSVQTAPASSAAKNQNAPKRDGPAETWAGFLIGAGGDHVDYRLTALTQNWPGEDGGLLVAIDGQGQIVFHDNAKEKRPALKAADHNGPGFAGKRPGEVVLRLEGKPVGNTYTLTASALHGETRALISQATLIGVQAARLTGGVALVSHHGPAGSDMGYAFRDWQVTGAKVDLYPERSFGPILAAQHTLSRGTLKMTAQMPPLGANDSHEARLQIRDEGQPTWRTVATAKLTKHSYTFPFRVDDWDATKNVPYRVVYDLRTAGGAMQRHNWTGTIRAEPNEKDSLVVTGFTGHKIHTGVRKWNHNGVWFPHNELVAAVQYHRPDFLFFSGDQIYEGDLSGVQITPLDKAYLDYLDKWYRWCWAFGDLARDVPCVCIPDDHDVYHGNVWGAGGRQADGISGKPAQDSGGYCMPASFVNAVQRTQTSHLPDPVDPTTVGEGIGVYYTDLTYAGVSFAVLEDRKWKSSPTVAVPEGKAINGWFQNPDFDPVKGADVPGSVLLGERQLAFLSEWAADYSNGIWMKMALSQTIFANVATLPSTANSDIVVPQLKFTPAEQYVEGDELAADGDSNGWPQTGRNRAIRELRRGFAFHLAGDQHLGSFIRYGVEDWDDAGYALCVPSIANTWPRRWFPPTPGQNRKPGSPRYTGQFKDGFGNRITVHAVSNPMLSDHEPAALYNRAPGYGIVRLNRRTRDVTVECWPRWEDPAKPNARQYPGWPATFNQQDNYDRKAVGYLATLKVTGMTDPVVQVVDQSSREVVYTLRIRGDSFKPKVFSPGRYAIHIGEPGTDRMKQLRGLKSVAPQNDKVIEVQF